MYLLYKPGFENILDRVYKKKCTGPFCIVFSYSLAYVASRSIKPYRSVKPFIELLAWKIPISGIFKSTNSV